MSQVRKGEAWIALRELVVHDHGPKGVHACSSVLGRNGDAEQAKLPAPAEEAQVWFASPIVLFGLGFNHVAHKVTNHLAEHAVLLGRVLQVKGGEDHGADATTPPLLRSGYHEGDPRAAPRKLAQR